MNSKVLDVWLTLSLGVLMLISLTELAKDWLGDGVYFFQIAFVLYIIIMKVCDYKNKR